jgi:LAO/AO transport system kinase
VRFRDSAGWRAPVVACCAATGFGVEGLIEAVAAHRAHLEARGIESVRLAKRAEQVAHALREGLAAAVLEGKGWGGHVRAELARRTPPHRLSDAILQAILKGVPQAPTSPESN